MTTEIYSETPVTYETPTESSTFFTSTFSTATSSTVTQVSGSSSPADHGSTVDNGLIIGLSVGIPCGVLLIAIGITLFWIYRKRKMPQKATQSENTDTNHYEVNMQSSSRNSALYDDVDVITRVPMYEKVLDNSEPLYATTISVN